MSVCDCVMGVAIHSPNQSHTHAIPSTTPLFIPPPPPKHTQGVAIHVLLPDDASSSSSSSSSSTTSGGGVSARYTQSRLMALPHAPGRIHVRACVCACVRRHAGLVGWLGLGTRCCQEAGEGGSIQSMCVCASFMGGRGV